MNYDTPSPSAMVLQMLAVTGHDFKYQLLELAQNTNNLSIVYGEFLDLKTRFTGEPQRRVLRQLIQDYLT